jgi:ectoine hydroxylase-related dioxygenase (phytanoyl-CoA dioxygenase family)
LAPNSSSQSREQLAEKWERQGFVILPAVFGEDELEAARRAALRLLPAPDAIDADTERRDALAGSSYAGLVDLPRSDPALTLVLLSEPALGLVESLLGTRDFILYQAQLWGKYGGLVNYEQILHRDYPRNTLLAPAVGSTSGVVRMFIYLSNVVDAGATRVVARNVAKSIDSSEVLLERCDHPGIYRKEQSSAGPSGTVLMFDLDTFHRATDVAPGSFRLVLNASFKRRDHYWVSYSPGLRVGMDAEWDLLVQASTSRQREVLGFPPIESKIWTETQRRSVARRYGQSKG